MNTAVSPATIAPPAANYVHAMLATNTERTLYTSGVVPIATDGTVPSALEDQAELVWVNISAILAEAEMMPTDIVSITTYVVVGEPLVPVMAARDRALNGHKAASTLLTVPALARPEWRVEVAIIAAR